MPPEWSKASGLVVWLCLGVLLWGLSIGAVYRDLNRRRLPRAEWVAWLALAGLLPGPGLLAYLLSRLLSQALPLPPGGYGPDGATRRTTLLKQAPQAAPRTGTIAASDLVQDTVFSRPPVAAFEVSPAEAPAIEVRPNEVLPRDVATVAVTLTVVAGLYAGQELLIETLPARIGRGAEASLRLDRDLGVSRQHAEFYRQDGRLRVRDLASIHGTRVNGVSVHDQAIEVGDKIEVGQSALVVKVVGA